MKRFVFLVVCLILLNVLILAQIPAHSEDSLVKSGKAGDRFATKELTIVSSPEADSPKVTVIKYNTEVNYTGYKNSNKTWSKIEYKGKEGFVPSSKISPWKWPTKSTKIGQRYKPGIHKGVDISPSVSGKQGDKVYSSMDGKVVYSGWLTGYGNVVYINHTYNGEYYQTRYAHFKNPPPVKTDQQIQAGDLVGYMGMTGRATGPHVHFEIRKSATGSTCNLSNSGSNPVNPLNKLNKP